MTGTRGADRLVGLLDELEELLSRPPGAGRGRDLQLAAWRIRMDEARREADLAPGERETLARMSGRVQGMLAAMIREREREMRALLVRILSSHAVYDALDRYRVPVRQGFFERTV